ncbi:transposase (plasmid) [Polymorphobacter sp. PAMC 29334]|uniref:IS66-like element accessory protein TnpA n=1 Tax=Polymorphobacter sp. PAMC 29334 TaxID=2862331 RepID=UPI001C6833C8|nr:transposase [Polymorphobacter sp. PAMC 29334]QYE33187.1 transposase [Polymorphobacter sp. PAMC 29334]
MADDETSYETLKTSLSEGLALPPRPERRRSWHPQQKMAIVQESCAPGAVPTQVARRYDISTGLLYTWRRQLLTAATDGFIRCEVVAESAAVALPAPDVRSPPALPVTDRTLSGTIEVELPSGTKLRVGGDVDAGALARVLDVLRR